MVKYVNKKKYNLERRKGKPHIPDKVKKKVKQIDPLVEAYMESMWPSGKWHNIKYKIKRFFVPITFKYAMWKWQRDMRAFEYEG